MTNNRTDLEALAVRSDYDALKAYGHSPAKAAEIVLDASRGNERAANWIAIVRQAVQP
jgi:hypothetical protein